MRCLAWRLTGCVESTLGNDVYLLVSYRRNELYCCVFSALPLYIHCTSLITFSWQHKVNAAVLALRVFHVASCCLCVMYALLSLSCSCNEGSHSSLCCLVQVKVWRFLVCAFAKQLSDMLLHPDNRLNAKTQAHVSDAPHQ